jgi:putative ABC transport system permease protein
MRAFTSIETAWQDLRYGIRGLRENKGLSLTIMVVLALGIGANATIFSVARAVLLRPLPFNDPDRLIRLWESNPTRALPEYPASAPNFKDWQSQQSCFDQLAALELATFNLTGAGDPERIAAASITANLIPALGVRPALGRNFLPEEETTGHNGVVLVSHTLWQRQFGGDPDLQGKSIQLNGQSYTVVGIMPPGFGFGGSRELWVPLVLDPAKEPWRADRANRNIAVYGRLKPGVTFDQATAQMNTLAEHLQQEYPQSNAGWGVRLRTFYDWIVPEQVRRSISVLFIAVGLLLLIACANVASLLLARATKRQKEIAIRAALGASRLRLIRQLLIESLLLSGLGGLLGLLLASWGTGLIISSDTQPIARLGEARIDGQVLGFAFGLSAVTALIFGLAPAWRASRVNLAGKLNETGRSEAGRVASRLRSSLVVGEVALALALLVGSGLMMRSFVRLQGVPLGFEPGKVLTMQISLPESKYGQREARVNFFDQLLERIREVPGVIDAGATTQPPASSGNWAVEISVEGEPASMDQSPSSADARAVTPDYFRTMGIPLLKGREFIRSDGGDKLIVSETFARRYWPNQDPIGKRLRPGSNNPAGDVVGVVGDVRDSNLQEQMRPVLYFPYAYIGMQGLVVAVHADAQPQPLAAALRAQVRSFDSEQPVYNIRTMDQIVSVVTAQPRFQTVLLTVFAIVALLLATVGIYSVMAYLVRQRRQEIGVRMALGADAVDILKMVIGQGMRQVLLGAALGLAGAFLLTRFMKSLFFGVSPTDPLTFIAVALLLVFVAFFACYLPAWRAARINPAVSLRDDS